MNTHTTERIAQVIGASGETGEPIFRTPCSVGSGEVDSEPRRFVFKDDAFGPRVSDLKTGRWMSTALVREMFEAIPRRKRSAAAIAAATEGAV